MRYPVIPLRGVIVFPYCSSSFEVSRKKSKNALEAAMLRDQKIFLSAQKNDEIEFPTYDEIYDFGTVAKIKQMIKLPGDMVRVFVEGVTLGRMNRECLKDDQVEFMECDVDEDIEIDVPESTLESAACRNAINIFKAYVKKVDTIPNEVIGAVSKNKRAKSLSNAIASYMILDKESRYEILRVLEPIERLSLVVGKLNHEIEVMEIEEKISEMVNRQMSENHREYVLREKLKAIKEELGHAQNSESEIDTWKRKIKELELSKILVEKLNKEIDRYSSMQPESAEGSVIKTYIDTVLSLPWKAMTKEISNIKKSEKILERDHYGLEKVKERVLEYLSVVNLTKSLKGPILCLVGPPGTGKTSIAKSMAKATGRKFVRMSLGGVRDEAEIRGHRRTYIGAMPGRIINSIKEVGVKNPVFLFDEIDKIGADFRGDPASALLEVLDPEQNKDFVDHYIEAPFDLSKVMFVTTANSLDTIPGPLRDRMEIISVSGYTEDEKVQIAKKYLVPKKVQEHGLTKSQFKIKDDAIRDVINFYTREAGVRNLEREIASLIRKVARKVAGKEVEKFQVTSTNLTDLLGKKKFRYDKIDDKCEVGVATGMAWTAVGGDTLFIETSAVPGTGKIQLTGQLGSVMQESAKTGISYVRSVAEKHGIDKEFYKNKDIHIHVPEGAVPKDGPSAGVTMAVAMISSLTGIPVRTDVSMTGEVTLRGRVLPVGGIKEKVLAAHRAGVKKVLLPAENERDIDDIPETVRSQLEFILLKDVDDALREVLVK